MKLLVVLALVALCVADLALDDMWLKYKDNHGKQYDSGIHEKYRRIVWEKNLQSINQHNLEADLGMHKFRLGINQYSDLTVDEHNKYLNGYEHRNTSTGSNFLVPEHVDAPSAVDWRKEGYVTNVKNQEHCGGCWAFGATGALEGQHFKKTGTLVSLSEQNLIDCSMKEGNHGCSGGLMIKAYEYIKMNDGIDTEASYPYEAKNGICRFKRADVGATLTGFMEIPKDDEEALMQAVATVGPIAIGMDASRASFHSYRQGVYEDSACSSEHLDHGVVLVGYGEEDGQKYWLVKNSWGESWGMNGYFMLARDRHNMCGVASTATYPLV